MADLADARRRAEEALAKWEGCRVCQTWKPVRSHALSLATALRALLAAGPEAKAPGHDRIAELESLLRECNAVCLCGCPDSEHEADECGESCGNDDHECIRVPRAVLAYVERLRSAAPPPSDAVREAAEVYRVACAAARDCRRAHATYRYETICDEIDERDRAAVALAEAVLAALRGGQKGEA